MNNDTFRDHTQTLVAHTVRWEQAVGLVLLVVFIGLVPLAAAGRFDWGQGWVYSLIMMGTNLLSRYLLFRKNPELVAERLRFTSRKGIKSWDKLLAPIIAIVGPLLVLIVAGLDKRNAWSPEVSLALQIPAIFLFLSGGMLGVWAMLENPFFSSVVRIQEDRKQTVITSGPYRFVRHPAYSGNILWWLVTPVILGSLWSFIPAGFVVVLFIVRAALEDRTLKNELSGYQEYAERVRYRLLPGAW